MKRQGKSCLDAGEKGTRGRCAHRALECHARQCDLIAAQCQRHGHGRNGQHKVGSHADGECAQAGMRGGVLFGKEEAAAVINCHACR